MTKKEARAIVEQIARDNGAAWLRSAIKSGTLYYSKEHVNRNGDNHWVTLAHVVAGINNKLDFFWPAPAPEWTTDDPGESARALLGSESYDVAAKAVGFNLRERCFVRTGGGMDMVFETAYTLGMLCGLTDTEMGELNALERFSMNRTDRTWR